MFITKYQSVTFSSPSTRYKKEYLMFNDDIQGTAATVLAGLYGAMKVQGLKPEDLKNQVTHWRLELQTNGCQRLRNVLQSRRRLHTRTFSWLKAPISPFTFNY